MELYKRIKARRKELGMSQEELAHKLGYKSRSTINKIETGINDITQSKICAFAKALDTTPGYLMGLDDDINSTELSCELLEKTSAALPDDEIVKIGAATAQISVSPEEGREKLVLMGYRYLDETDKGIIWGEIRQMLRSDKYKDTDFTL